MMRDGRPVGAAHALDVFPRDYAQAREQFLAAARAAGLPLEHHIHPLRGLQGEELAMDIARQGPADAQQVLLVSSACHGAEGFCGSGVQLSLLRDATWMQAVHDSGVAVVYVHALNPYGFSWLRRVTHEGVDLNRNFVDFSGPLPANPAYGELHPWLVPDAWPPATDTESALEAYVRDHGMPAVQAIVSQGQYEVPSGLFYGGREPTWSHRAVRQVLRQHGARARDLAWVDLHTGLGPSGVGERIHMGRDDAQEIGRARAWWGSGITTLYDGTSTSAPLQGLMAHTVYADCPQARFTGIALEYGTYPIEQVIGALRADHWLALHPQAPAALQAQIRQQMRDTFFVDTSQWKAQILAQGHEVMHQGLRGLLALAP